MSDLKLKNVSKAFGNVRVINGVDLEVADGEFVVFVGPSGCGKSTLLRMIAGLEDATEGDVIIDGESVNNVSPAKRGLAMVFQSYALYPHMSVRKNLAFGLETMKVARAEIARKVQQAADILQISELLDRKPGQLSGGQRQRVAIGRAIVREPGIFLFDEPLSNLDAELRMQMRVEIKKLHHRLGTTMIFVTHDQVEAMTLADKIVVLRTGRLEQVGTPLDLYNNPANMFVAGFLGSPRMNFITADIRTVSSGGIEAVLPGGQCLPVGEVNALKPGAHVTIGIRPESLSPTDSSGALLSGALQIAEHLGDKTYAYVSLPGNGSVTAEFKGQVKLRPEEPIHLKILDGKYHVFDTAGRAVWNSWEKGNN